VQRQTSADEFVKLADRHKDSVYRQMLRVCGSKEDAEDSLATALLNAFKARDQLQDVERFQAWLTQIARRACHRLRRTSHGPVLLALTEFEEQGKELSAPDDVSKQMHEAEIKQCLMSALESLPGHYRDVYVATEIDGMTAEATAKKLHLSVANVKSRLHRARAALRKKIDCDLEDLLGVNYRQ
jgi:RNA polymerase sigma-70 factor (ECF subfamily)